MLLRNTIRPSIIILLLLISGNCTLYAQEDCEIRSIKFNGNNSFSKNELKEQTSINTAGWLEKKLLKKKPSFYTSKTYETITKELSYFYQSEGFVDIFIQDMLFKYNKKKTKVYISINISEGKPYTIDSIDVSALQKDSLFEQRKSLLTRLKTAKGDRFRDESVIADKNSLTDHLTNQGYAYAEISYKIKADTSAHNADITWEVNKGSLCHFGDVSLTPVARTPERITKGQIEFKKGDVFDKSKLIKTQEQIFDLGTFRIVSVKALMSKTPGDTIPVGITMKEAPATSTRLGVGYGKEDRFRTFGEIQWLNFIGGARRLNVYVSHSAIEPYMIKATITQPAIFSPTTTLALTPYVHKLIEPGYELITWGSNLTLLQHINSHTTGHINLGLTQTLLDTTTVAHTENTNTTLAKQYTKSNAEAGLLYDNTAPRFDPSSGWSVNFTTQLNNTFTGTKIVYLKPQLEVKHFYQLFYRTILASRIKLGSIHILNSVAEVPVDDRFFAGGSHSVRGWSRQQLGPTDSLMIPIGGHSLLETSIEPRIKIYGPVSIALFVDVGNVWTQTNYFDLSRIHATAGAGIRIATPIGPIGIDAARPVFEHLSKWQFHLNIGNPF